MQLMFISAEVNVTPTIEIRALFDENVDARPISDGSSTIKMIDVMAVCFEFKPPSIELVHKILRIILIDKYFNDVDYLAHSSIWHRISTNNVKVFKLLVETWFWHILVLFFRRILQVQGYLLNKQ